MKIRKFAVMGAALTLLLAVLPCAAQSLGEIARQERSERAGLAKRAHARPAQLSGGECQRAAVVRALINKPKVVLADEPTGSLDQAAAADIGTLLVELKREEHTALIVATHSLTLAQRMDAITHLREGVLNPQP